MRFLLAVAWRNLWRHGRRTLITAGAMGVGVAMCMSSIALQDGMYAQMFDVMVTDTLGHVQVHHPDYPGRKRLYDVLEETDALRGAIGEVDGVVLSVPRLFTYALAGGQETSAGAQISGVLPVEEAQLTGIDQKLEAGAWLAEAPAQQVVLGVDLAEELGISGGEELVLVGQDAFGGMANDLYTVVGTVRTGQTAKDRGGAWTHIADLQTFLAMEGKVHEVLVVGDDVEGAPAIREGILALPETGDALVRTWNESSPSAAQMMELQSIGALILLAVVLSAAALGVLNTMLMSVFERIREFGVLRALGLGPGRLMALVVLESMMLAAVASAMGLVLGLALDGWLVVYGLDFSVGDGKGLSFAGITLDPVIHAVIRPEGILITIASVFVVTLLAAIWPALRAARMEPVEAMREI